MVLLSMPAHAYRRCIVKHVLSLLASVLILSGFCGCGDDTPEPPIIVHDFGINDPNRYVVMGDSISAGENLMWPARLSSMISNQIINEAVAGEWAKEGAERVKGVLAAYHPGYLLVLYGANDVIMKQPPPVVVEHLREIIQAAKTNQTIPIVATMTPMINGLSIFQGGVDAVNAGIVQMGLEEDILIVRLDLAFGDGIGLMTLDYLHPNVFGQQLIAQTFYNAMNPVLEAAAVKSDAISSSRWCYR